MEIVETRPPSAPESTDIEERFDDDPARVEALARWRAERAEWVAREQPARAAAKLFEQLYELYGRLEREPEHLELLVGDGLLTWNTSVGPVRHPVLLQRVQLEFTPTAPEFTIYETDRPQIGRAHV